MTCCKLKWNANWFFTVQLSSFFRSMFAGLVKSQGGANLKLDVFQ